MIRLPWPPTVNTYYTIARGRKILSTRGRNYKKTCHAELMMQRVRQGMDGPYSITINAYPPDKRKRDLDNLLKPVLDALTSYGAIFDDSAIDDLRIQRFNNCISGKLEILISSI